MEGAKGRGGKGAADVGRWNGRLERKKKKKGGRCSGNGADGKGGPDRPRKRAPGDSNERGQRQQRRGARRQQRGGGPTTAMRRTPTTAARRTPTTTDDVVAARAARTTGQAAAPAAADASVWGRLGESGAAGSATTRHAHTGTAGARDHSFRRQAGNNLYDHVAYTRRDYDLSFHEHRFCVDTDFTLRCTMGSRRNRAAATGVLYRWEFFRASRAPLAGRVDRPCRPAAREGGQQERHMCLPLQLLRACSHSAAMDALARWGPERTS